MKIIRSKVISKHYNDPFVSHFRVNKTKELIGRKYYWPSLKKDVEFYIKRYDICLALKAVRYKPYSNFQSLLTPTHWWKDFSMNFVTRPPISTNWKNDRYNSILVIVDRLTKMVHYEPVKVTIDISGLAKVTMDIVMRHHGFPNSIISDHGAIFTFKF